MAMRDGYNTGYSTAWQFPTTVKKREGQTFIASSTYTPLRVLIQARRVGSPGVVNAYIYEAAGTYGHPPTGSIICSGTVDLDTMALSYEWFEVLFSVTGEVTAGTRYVFYLDNGGFGSGSDYIYWRLDLGDSAYSGTQNWSPRYNPAQDPEQWDYSLNNDHMFEVWDTLESGGAPSKASNPAPADASGPGIDFETPTLSWSGDGDTYDVYGGGGANWVLLASGISDTSYTLDANDLLQFKDAGSASWRVDSINDEGTTTGDTWTFDPRPAKVTNPSPASASTGKSLSQLLGWDAATYATSYDVWVNSGKMYSETTSNANLLPLVTDVLDWGTLYTWRVDSNNYYGTTEGDEWTFTTLDFDPPITFHRLLSDQSISTDPFNPATMYFTGENFTVTMRRLLAFCGSSLWYESIDAED